MPRLDPPEGPARLSASRSPSGEFLWHIRQVAKKNKVFSTMIGQGYLRHRHAAGDPAQYPGKSGLVHGLHALSAGDFSQGRLEALLNYPDHGLRSDRPGDRQCLAAGRGDGGGGSHGDGAAGGKVKIRYAVFVDENCHPQNIAVIRTRAAAAGDRDYRGRPERTCWSPRQALRRVFQYPGTYGGVQRFHRPDRGAARDAKALGIVIADPSGADIAEGTGRDGGRYCRWLDPAFRRADGLWRPACGLYGLPRCHKRAMPGRIVGVSIDARGNKAYRLSLQTREQHIRREKATSNVCTAQALLAVMASFYAVFHGPEGLRAIAAADPPQNGARGARAGGERVHGRAGAFFRHHHHRGRPVAERGDRRGCACGGSTCAGSARRGSASPSMRPRRPETVEAVCGAFGIQDRKHDLTGRISGARGAASPDDYLDHPVFHMNRAETEMMRYMRRLADRDLALDRRDDPAGQSCTMKLNAAVEMMPITWPEFANAIHPFAPADQVEGYTEMLDDLSRQAVQDHRL